MRLTCRWFLSNILRATFLCYNGKNNGLPTHQHVIFIDQCFAIVSVVLSVGFHRRRYATRLGANIITPDTATVET